MLFSCLSFQHKYSFYFLKKPCEILYTSNPTFSMLECLEHMLHTLTSPREQLHHIQNEVCFKYNIVEMVRVEEKRTVIWLLQISSRLFTVSPSSRYLLSELKMS